MMKSNYNLEKAKKLKAPMKIVYEVNGDGGGCWSIVCNTEKIEITEGEIEDFEAKITYIDFDSLYKTYTGEISGVNAPNFTSVIIQRSPLKTSADQILKIPD